MLGALLLIAVVAHPVGAAELPEPGTVSQTENVRAELIAELSSIVPGDTFWVALQLDIRDGWHTYWRNPGDSGEPTRINWTVPGGVDAGEIQWPYPQRIPYGHLVNFGYEDRALHLVRISVPDTWPAGKPLKLAAEASWLVCEDICIPESASFSLTLPAAAGRLTVDHAAAADINAALMRLPAQPDWPASYEVEGDTVVLDIVTGAGSTNLASVSFFPNEWGAVEPASEQELAVRDNRLVLRMESAGSAPDELDGVLVIEERSGGETLERAVEIGATRGGPVATSGGALEMGTGPGILKALVLAFLGGLILNLMPCVFPVLSVKAVGIVKYAAGSSRELHLSGLTYTAGVLAFMVIVGGVLVALRSAGAEIGWGFQLQSPVFVTVMALVLFTLGLSLSGYFTFGAAMMGWGGGLAGQPGYVGSFFTGALAALVATPCTAPFMGAAIGYALSQPWAVVVTVMLSLGLGLALPYLLLTWIPGLASRLPRPGAWMDRLKQLLAFPLYAAAAWLVWVLSIQAGPEAVLAALMAMILVAFAVWLQGATRGMGRRGRTLGSVATVAVTALAIGVGFVSRVADPSSGPRPQITQGEWPAHAEPFSIEKLEALRATGTPVFVNITAAWCITCKLNEQVALSSRTIARDFADRGIVYLKGDWTSRDAEISRYLNTYGRGGVPLYVVYKDDQEKPLVLPQILTESLVLSAVEDIPRKTIPQIVEKRS